MALNLNPLGRKITDILGGFGNFANKTGQAVGNTVLGLPVIHEAVQFGQQKNPTLGDFTKGILSTGYKYSPPGLAEQAGGQIAATVTNRPQVSLTGTHMPVQQAEPIFGNKLLGQSLAAANIPLELFGARAPVRTGPPLLKPAVKLAGQKVAETNRALGEAGTMDPDAPLGKPKVGLTNTPKPRFSSVDDILKDANLSKTGKQGTQLGPEELQQVVNLFRGNPSSLAGKAVKAYGNTSYAKDGDLVLGQAGNHYVVAELDKTGQLNGRIRVHSTPIGSKSVAAYEQAASTYDPEAVAARRAASKAKSGAETIIIDTPAGKVTVKQEPNGELPIDAPKPKVGLKIPAPGEGLKTRGFAKNVAKNAEGDTAQAVVEAIPGHKPITNKDTLRRAAAKIDKDPQAAYTRIVNKPQLTSANDVATGNTLLRRAIESEDINGAIEIGKKLGIDGTKLGQAVQAYATFKRTSPEGIVQYASKQAGKAGRTLKPEVAQGLVTRAKAVAKMPEGLGKAKATRELTAEATKQGRTWKDAVGNILNAPRAAQATADFSAPLRQGAVLGSRFPGQFGRAAKDSARWMFKPEAYERSMYEITQRPNYTLMKSSGLAVKGAEHLTGTEEQFMTSFLEGKTAKKLGVGHVVAGSDRAYSGFLTKLRADVFDKIVADSKSAGVELDEKALKSLSKFINSASGRGSGKTMDRHIGLLASGLFSPRLWKSRIDTLNPVYYARLDPIARKYALQAAASFLGVVSTILGVAKAGGAQVEMDPRSADFAKIRIGNTRYDILGGHQQNIRLIAQMVTGQKINSETGELQTLGPDRGYGKPSRLDLLYQFIENKENPVVSFATKALRGTDPTGQPLNLAAEAGKLFVPLNAQGIYDTAKDQGSLLKGAAMNVPGIFGVGVQTYGKKGATPTPSNAPPPTFGPAASAAETAPVNTTGLPDANGQLLTGDNTSNEAKAAKKAEDTQRKDELKAGVRLGGTEELNKAQTRIDTATKKFPEGLSKDSQTTLTRYAKLNANGKDKFNADLNNVYNLKVAQYEEKKRAGGMSNLEDYKAQEDLYRAKVQKDYSPEAVKLYSMSKAALRDYFASNPGQRALFNEVQKLDGALTQSGLQDKNKFYSGLGTGGRAGYANPFKYSVSPNAGGSAKPKVSFRSTRTVRSAKGIKGRGKATPKAKVSIRKGVL